MAKIICHIDVNSAFLSWSAAYRVHVLGDALDLREIPSAVCGDPESRHGIILAKSAPAKLYGVKTGEPLFQARQKCPQLVVVAPDYALYVENSRRFIAILREVAPLVEQYSIDEAYCDLSGTEKLYGDPLQTAVRIKDRIRDELGFTVNVGVSCNKLLAKMASDVEKPDRVRDGGKFPKHRMAAACARAVSGRSGDRAQAAGDGHYDHWPAGAGRPRASARASA